MPGIAGVIGPGAAHQHHESVAAMVACMRHEPQWLSETVSSSAPDVCAGWVQRPGTFAARQCRATTPDRPRLRLLLSGEAWLGSMGADESLLHGYRADEPFCDGLDGLFSGLVIDHDRHRVVLFNDRYGSERLYIHRSGGLTWFASEAKALLAVLPSTRAFDERGVADFTAYGSVLDGRTLFRGIELLRGGSMWAWSGSTREPQRSRYFEPARWESLEPLSRRDFVEQFQALFKGVVQRHAQGLDGTVGISLTGGLDTRMIMACLHRDAMPTVAYTYADRHGSTLDGTIAAQVARLCGVPHRLLRLDDAFLRDFAEHADRSVFLTDGCATMLHTHELFLSRLAAKCAPVRLTGNYGSEVLRSVSTFKPTPLAADALTPAARQAAAAAIDEQRGRSGHPLTDAAFRETPWHLFGPLAAARVHLTVRTPYLDNELVCLAYRCPAPLRASVVPALRLVERHHPALAALSTDRGVKAADGALRAQLRRAWSTLTFKLDYWHIEGMPRRLAALDGVVDAMSRSDWLPKHRFLPYRTWLRGPLAGYLAQAAATADRRQAGPWPAGALPRWADEHVLGQANRLRELNLALTLDAVERTLLSAPRHLAGRQTALLRTA